ncbi:hypothetical protein NLJ89_g1565 [Agrocybe chaxingu]|uniref:Succinate dehydrogenase assembly factor 2, mitochondrial n=1 Tax=Agrocybe chaxingu TaxID=84603 RepID=A0A9W8MZU6_9AGAR|nr:hypothetical protein NLJ89_g1565 [Agrocybe chaxingu]
MELKLLQQFFLLAIRSVKRRLPAPQYLAALVSRIRKAVVSFLYGLLAYLRRIGKRSGDPPGSSLSSSTIIRLGGGEQAPKGVHPAPTRDPVLYTNIQESDREIIPIDNSIACSSIPGTVYPNNLFNARRSKQALENSKESHRSALKRSSQYSHASSNSSFSDTSSMQGGRNRSIGRGPDGTLPALSSCLLTVPGTAAQSCIDVSAGIERIPSMLDGASSRRAPSLSTPSMVTYKGPIMDNPFLKKMCPVMPEATRRYNPKKPPDSGRKSTVIPELTREFTRDMPLDSPWSIVRHREGGCYFYHEQERVVTDSDMTDPKLLQQSAALFKALAQYIDDEELSDQLPTDRHLFLDFDVEPGDQGDISVYYYYVDHEAMAVFFLHEYDAKSLTTWEEAPRSSSQLHLGKEIEAQYWYFLQLYPTCRALSKDLIFELRDTCTYWIADVETCQNSTAPYSLKALSEILDLANSIGDDAGSICPGAMAMLARHMYMFAHTGFIHYHGEPYVRLDRIAAVHDDQPYKKTRLIKIISPLLFFDPDHHLRLLQNAWVDRIIHKTKWDEITEAMKDEWIGRVVYGSLVLASSVSFLTVPGVVDHSEKNMITTPQIFAYLSIFSSTTSVILVLLLHRHQQVRGGESASQAQQYLRDQVSTRFGLEPLAIHHSLPHAFLMWSAVFFLLAIITFCVLTGNVVSIVVALHPKDFSLMLRLVMRSAGASTWRRSNPRRFVSSTLPRFADPWPLPHTPEHMASTVTPSSNNPIAPLPRNNESIDTLRARLVYQSRKRGTLESDLLLSTFARDHLSSMPEAELKEYDKLLDEADWDIYYWATGERTPSQRWADSPLLEKLRIHARNEGKVVRKMPPL